MSNGTKLVLPPKLEDCNNDNLVTLASLPANIRLAADIARQYFEIRLGGLSILQFYKKELTEPTKVDIDWYVNDLSKPLVYDKKKDFQLIRSAKAIPRTEEIDLTEANGYLKECYAEEKELVEDYIKQNYEELKRKYPLVISEWFVTWYGFWADRDGLRKHLLDWVLYFSLLNPRLADHPQVRFARVIGRLNTIIRAETKPGFLEYCWKNEEIRGKVLRGEQFDYPRYICPYSTIFSYILKRNQVKRIIAPKGSRPTFLQVEKYMEEGLDFPTALSKANRT